MDYEPTQSIIEYCLMNLTLGLNNIEDLNTERESLLELVNELFHVLVQEA